MEVIYMKARDMMSKPRYWQVAYPLVITSLCVAPQDFFLKNWIPCFEGGIPKLKVCIHTKSSIRIYNLTSNVGEAFSTIHPKWHYAISMVVFVPLSRNDFDCRIATGRGTKAFLPFNSLRGQLF